MADTQQRDFLGIGWRFPVAFDPIAGDAALSAYLRDVKEAIRIILQTAPGERVMRPRFGCGIHELVFEEMNTTALSAIEASVRDALLTYEPRIELIGIEIEQMELQRGMLLVSIDYRVRRTNQTDNLVYPYYFEEGARQ